VSRRLIGWGCRAKKRVSTRGEGDRPEIQRERECFVRTKGSSAAPHGCSSSDETGNQSLDDSRLCARAGRASVHAMPSRRTGRQHHGDRGADSSTASSPDDAHGAMTGAPSKRTSSNASLPSCDPGTSSFSDKLGAHKVARCATLSRPEAHGSSSFRATRPTSIRSSTLVEAEALLRKAGARTLASLRVRFVPPSSPSHQAIRMVGSHTALPLPCS